MRATYHQEGKESSSSSFLLDGSEKSGSQVEDVFVKTNSKIDVRGYALKVASLTILCFLTSLTTLLMHRSRQERPDRLYTPSVSVLMGEILKFIISIVFVVYEGGDILERNSPTFPRLLKSAGDNFSYEEGSKTHDGAFSVRSRIVRLTQKLDWRFALPSLLYVCQNLLQLLSSTFISAIVYQSTCQAKIITTAILSVFLLNRSISRRQWGIIAILLLGILILNNDRLIQNQLKVNIKSFGLIDEKSPFRRLRQTPSFYSKLQSHSIRENRISLLSHAKSISNLKSVIGISGLIISCFLGSLASVYMEKQVKTQKQLSLSFINMQLSVFGIASASIAVIHHCFTTSHINPFHDFTVYAWLTVLVRVLQGYIVSIVLRYADSILKGFSTSFAIVLTMFIEHLLYRQNLSSMACFGAGLVCLSSLMQAFID